MGFVYDPQAQLPQLFPDAQALANIDEVLEYIRHRKSATNQHIAALAASYEHPIDIDSDIHAMVDSFQQVRLHALKTHDSILQVTAAIQRLDTTKQNLVLSMKVLKRLQMLMNAFNSLLSVIPSHDYKQIASYLGAVKGLLDFFKDYKSIDEIALLYQRIHLTQNKLVDDVFIDFEDSFTNHFTNDTLQYGCEILELAGPKNKDKLLTWFYNLQLKEISSIFTSGEAGSIENLNRRYLFFNNVLENIQTNFLSVFPKRWLVDLELSKLFCKISSQEITQRLADTSVSSSDILDALTNTLAFERKLDEKFNTTYFSRVILAAFEPYLITWVREQEHSIAARIAELYLRPKIPTEIANSANSKDLLAVLRVNSVPNFADSSVELFKLFQKSLSQTIKVSHGEILVDLARVFGKFIKDYHNNILVPVYNSSLEHPEGVESIKYLTMLFNTADYIIQNTIDLEDRFIKVIDVAFREKIQFDYEKNLYFELINNAIKALVNKVCLDLRFSWRLFENNAWDSLEAVVDTSNYMEDFIASLKENHRMICPLIIRESYVRNYMDRLVERAIIDFMNELALVKPLSITAIEQILFDVASLKEFFTTIFDMCDPNYDEGSENHSAAPKAYLRHLGSQFSKLEILLKLLLTPTLPVENIVESYVAMIGDKSTANLRKVLTLKGVGPSDQQRYVENFKLVILSRDDLQQESPILLHMGSESHDSLVVHPSSQPPAAPVVLRDVTHGKSPEPHIPEFLKNNSAKLQAIKLNSALRDFTINGENHVNKLNENFKSFGKFFRKDD